MLIAFAFIWKISEDDKAKTGPSYTVSSNIEDVLHHFKSQSEQEWNLQCRWQTNASIGGEL